MADGWSPSTCPRGNRLFARTIDWSHGLLTEAESEVVSPAIGVFAGGCTLEAAEAVCDTSRDLGVDLFEGISSLVE